MSKYFNIIVAKTYLTHGIGKNGRIPWNIPDDFKHFKYITTKNNGSTKLNSIIMGKNTWKSLPKNPLPNRHNIIVSKTLYDENKYNTHQHENINYTDTFRNALTIANKISDNIYVIGGQKIYEEAIEHYNCNKLYITDIYNNFICDTYFPKINETVFKLKTVSEFKQNNNIDFRFLVYNKYIPVYQKYILKNIYKNNEEIQLLNLMQNIIEHGEYKENRTDTNIFSIFSPPKLYYNLEDTFPICTTKKIFLRGIFEELMFILRGQTDNQILIDKNVHIWTGNTTRKFLDNNNLKHLKENDMGATYGFNMRYFGEEYIDCNSQHVNLKKNSDQLIYLIDLLKNNKNSRRMIINLWNPNSLNNCSLPPCLMLYQFNVTNNKLNLQATLRSSDVYLANSWNTVYSALLVHLLCNVNGVNLIPGKLTINIGDAHIYENHLYGAIQQIERTPKPFPKLKVLYKKNDITKFEFDDIKLIGYNPYKNSQAMKVDMVI
jgi:dihydrofolate reductase/thymidylate synthase